MSRWKFSSRRFDGISEDRPFKRQILIIDKNGHETELTPDRSLAIKNHSPTGFNWGYGGSGPAQTALAILLEVTDSKEIALEHYQAFKDEQISRIRSQNSNWSIWEKDIVRWLRVKRGVWI